MVPTSSQGQLPNMESSRLLERLRFLESDLIEIKNERKQALMAKVNSNIHGGSVKTRDLDKLILEINSVWSFV